MIEIKIEIQILEATYADANKLVDKIMVALYKENIEYITIDIKEK